MTLMTEVKKKKKILNYSIEKNNRCVVLNKIYYINFIIF